MLNSKQARSASRREQGTFQPTNDNPETEIQISGRTVGNLATTAVRASTPPKADLIVEDLNVETLGNDDYRITAVLENGTPTLNLPPHGSGNPQTGADYLGGGVFKLTRTSGGTILGDSATSNPPATPDVPVVIASMPIPKLHFHDKIKINAITHGRAVFGAAATGSVALNSTPLNDANPLNNSQKLDNLIRHDYPLNTFTLGLIPSVGDAVNHASIKLDANDSHIVIPGVLDQHFKIPTKTISQKILVTTVSATYSVNNLQSTFVSLSYEQGGLAITAKFADNAHALHTPSSIFPDLGVSNLQVKVFLPLSYNGSLQLVQVGTPRVVVTGDWHVGGPFGKLIDLLLPDINKKVGDALAGMIAPKTPTIAFMINKPLHDLTKGGRILSADIQADQMILSVETPN